MRAPCSGVYLREWWLCDDQLIDHSVSGGINCASKIG